jgi:hypothetical protein
MDIKSIKVATHLAKLSSKTMIRSLVSHADQRERSDMETSGKDLCRAHFMMQPEIHPDTLITKGRSRIVMHRSLEQSPRYLEQSRVRVISGIEECLFEMRRRHGGLKRAFQ